MSDPWFWGIAAVVLVGLLIIDYRQEEAETGSGRLGPGVCPSCLRYRASISHLVIRARGRCGADRGGDSGPSVSELI